MENILIARVEGRLRAYPLKPVHITSHLGSARLVYLTDDGWVGARIAGDPNPARVDEIRAEHCRVVPS